MLAIDLNIVNNMSDGIIACGIAGLILAILIIYEYLTKDEPDDDNIEC